ncbi:MAG: tRNA (adenosine(37)-N6)-threonylcarbamoyltransferase complex ATPase subunit type 1 TsaE [Anaerolineaceae bacterium]|nr:tRNA (adenosine(37)-N6)-threonylcarbamoyltransferase complex ATPase subunit type 1 TsaE [Anaerolineaceae bacterium]
MTILSEKTTEFISNSAEQTRRLGMRLGSLLQTSMLVCLTGDLGSGKTTLTQGLTSGWGSSDPVSSPTFVLINEYYRLDGEVFFHLDTYRLGSSFEAEELDLDMMIDSGVLVIEWAERIRDVLPQEALWIECEYISGDKRRFVFKPVGGRYEMLVEEFRKRSFGGR